MLSRIQRIINQNKYIPWVLIAGFIVQVVTSLTAIGVSSADQHFQIVEFSMYQLQKANGAVQVWEIDNFVRPTLQVYLFSAYHLACNFLGLTDPYAQLTVLRLFLGMAMFVVFNAMALFYFKNHPPRTLLFVLLLVNFSWALPYTRTLFSSEMMSSLFFFGSLLLYEYLKNKRPGFLPLVVTGFLFSLAFYFRFQMAFAMAGVAVWIVFFEKKYSHILPLLLGFAVGVALNVWLDYGFYNEWIFTPYTYFYANIIDGRADYFGTSSFLRYIGLILLVAPAPLLSFVLFWFLLKTSFRNFTNPVVLSVVLFIVFHSMVGHKEERFMFPIFNALPLMIGWSIPEVEKLFQSRRRWVQATLSVLLGATIFLNFFLLVVMAAVPFSQTILFSKLLSDKFENRKQELYCVGQTPFETPSGNQMEFYKAASRNISVKKFKTLPDLLNSGARPEYISSQYNAIKENLPDLERMGYQPVLCSSELLWSVNKFLHRRNIQTINEIWMLYRRE